MSAIEQYREYLHQLETSEDCIFELKQFMLDNMIVDFITEQDLFELVELCKQKGYILSLATAYLFLCWFTMNTNLKKAKDYNQKAKEVIELLPNYESDITYLSILNNSVLMNVNLGQYYDSYVDAKYGIYLAKKYHYDHHLYALLNNSTYILLELGLNKQALSQMMANYDENDKGSHRISYWVILSQVYITLGEYENAYQTALKANEVATQLQVYRPIQFDRLLLEIACKMNNLEMASKYFSDLQESIKYFEENESTELYNAIYSKALYYQLIKDYDNAEICYELVLKHASEVIGVKNKWYNTLAEFYISIDKPKKANQIYKLLQKHHNENNEIITNMLDDSQSELWSSKTELSYDAPYRLVTNILELSQEISACLNYSSLVPLITNKMKLHLPLEDVKLYILRNDELCYLNDKDDYTTIPCTDVDINLCLNEGRRKELDKNGYRYCFEPLYFQDHINGILCTITNESTILSPFEVKSCSLLAGIIASTVNSIEQYIHAITKSKQDFLTGLYNREGFSENLAKHSGKYTKIGIVMVDIDDFKIVNDTYGHFAGDAVLQNLAKHLTSIPNSIPSRFGGEEFCIAIEVQDENHLISLCTELLHRIEKSSLQYKGNEIKYTVSAGAVLLETDEPTAIHNADIAMYKAKRSGKNCVILGNN
ncbi:GGDEF domain-containing protein [Anaerorhabdus sp.]|uniref:GGDEF domain-containing protein n=1 Tax=Anaerorhabdus sp. TaxID=1872524 RepID=UPI002FC9FB6B